ncbi:MAG: hypothetical protein HUU38_23760 [Anaerolineales bacterium]|nr:hypothetical protein [Anaerolineales bacterium]
MNCWEMLGALIAWETFDPKLSAEHFLTVAAYNLQHPAQFTDEVMVGLREAVVDYLDHGVSPHFLRQRAARAYEGKRRVLKPEAERHPVLRAWPLTIASVYLPDQPEGAAERVRLWGEAIRRTFNA